MRYLLNNYAKHNKPSVFYSRTCTVRNGDCVIILQFFPTHQLYSNLWPPAFIFLHFKTRELLFDLPEFYALLVGSVLGMNLLASSNNLLMIYLSLEFVSLMSYLLVGYVRGSVRSSEAALKYVLYGAVASGIFLYGASLYYGLNGTLDVKSFLTI